MEPIIGVINACLPHFPPVFHKLGSSRFATSVSQIFRTEKSNMGSISHRKSKGTLWSIGSKPVSQRKGEFVTLDDEAVELSSTYINQNVPQGEIEVRSDFRVENVAV
jgi:hypothetical protein